MNVISTAAIEDGKQAALDGMQRVVPPWYAERGYSADWLAGYDCCNNERRNMNGGCDNCGDPSY